MIPPLQQVRTLQADIARVSQDFLEEWRWAASGAYEKDVTESEKTSGGGISNPTALVGAPNRGRYEKPGDRNPYATRRNSMELAFKRAQMALDDLQAALAHLQDAQPKFRPTLEPERSQRGYDSKKEKRAVERAKFFQRRREVKGEGYGEA